MVNKEFITVILKYKTVPQAHAPYDSRMKNTL